MPTPFAFPAVNLLLLGLLSSHVIVATADVDCPTPMKPVTDAQAKKLRPRGTFMFTDEPSRFSTLLPAVIVTEKDYFNAKIKPECTNGKDQHQWAVSYSVNGTAIKQTLTESPPATFPCKKWHDAEKWYNPKVFYGDEQPSWRDNKLCLRGWRPLEIGPNRTEDVAYEQLMTDFFHSVVMPYTKKKRPFYYCNAGVQKLQFTRIGACIKELMATVRINGKKYGKGKRAARAWGQVDYTCYGENNKQSLYMTVTMPYVLECDWNINVE
jgi:hypothetical protein